MPVIAANEIITVASFGKAGEHCQLVDGAIHLFANTIDAGLQFVFREDHRYIDALSCTLKGTIKFNTEWGRVRFEGYEDVSAIEPSYVSEQAIPLEAERFTQLVYQVGKNRHLRKIQFVFVGPAIIDLWLKDLTVK
jgi:hypothetical protein